MYIYINRKLNAQPHKWLFKQKLEQFIRTQFSSCGRIFNITYLSVRWSGEYVIWTLF